MAGCGRCRPRPACGTSRRWSIRNDRSSRVADRRPDVYRAEIAKTRVFSSLIGGRVARSTGRVVGMRRRIARRAYAGERLAARRRRRIVHRSAVVRRREEGARLGVARGGRRAHLPEEPVDARARARVLLGARARDRAAPVAREPALSGRRRGGSSPAVLGRAIGRRGRRGRRRRARSGRPSIDSRRASSGSRGSGSAISIQPRPIVRGHEIVLEPHIVSVDHPRGIRYVRGIDLVALIELAPATRQVPDLYETYVRRAGPAALHDFLFALATAVARGWLVSE